jgi:Ca2+-binding EF-hand superfamily protein
MIKYERFEPVMMRVLQERRYRSLSEDMIRKAFAVLDKEKKGFLDPEELSKILMEEGVCHKEAPVTLSKNTPTRSLTHHLHATTQGSPLQPRRLRR